MKKTRLESKFELLEELIRTAYNILNPDGEDLGYLRNKDLRNRLYGKYPACFLKLEPIGRDTSAYLLPLCNRHGIEDPKVIAISIKVVQKLIEGDSGRFDNNILITLLSKLQHRHDVFVKTVPKPPIAAAKKANVTKHFNQMRNHLLRGDLIQTAED
jgi:hypothetical protein